MSDKPLHWFRTIDEITEELKTEPQAIEYLNINTGETYIHFWGTAYWLINGNKLNLEWLKRRGITHARIKDIKEVEITQQIKMYRMHI